MPCLPLTSASNSPFWCSDVKWLHCMCHKRTQNQWFALRFRSLAAIRLAANHSWTFWNNIHMHTHRQFGCIYKESTHRGQGKWLHHTQKFGLGLLLKPPIRWLTREQPCQSDIKRTLLATVRKTTLVLAFQTAVTSLWNSTAARICRYNKSQMSCVTGCFFSPLLTYLYLPDVCSLFVPRPTELFRSCNVQSDQGAMNDIKLWSNGTIKMPFMNIPVLDIRKCMPDMWKAVACSLQIKPCHSKFRGSVICKYVYPLPICSSQLKPFRQICVLKNIYRTFTSEFLWF